jgi:transcriptional regulator of acetoin/glycerol metabolism
VPGFDVFSLVMDAAAAIENSLFRPARDRLLVHFHPRAELLGTPMEGLLQVDADGRVCGANRMAARLLCMPRPALAGQAFAALFDRRLQGLFAQPARQRADLVEMQTHVGLLVMARFEGEAAPDMPGLQAGQTLRSGQPHNNGSTVPTSLRTLECEAIERTLAALGGNVSATAKALGISRNTIYRRRQGLGEPAP